MSMFSELFKHLPDADKLLNLEPDQLAGYLLVSLEDREYIKPESDITYNHMRHVIDRNSHINYPHGCHEDVLLAIMEAWQYLLSERLVAPRPIDLKYKSYIPSANTYFVTKRGKEIETLDNFKDYRKADLLQKHHLHPIIADKVWRIFAQGSYGTAVLEAYKQVEIAVREAGGYTKADYGHKLMTKAFDEVDGNLTDPCQHPDEKKARKLLFLGVIGAYKNPSSHHEVEFAPEEAAETIIIASHLLRIVDTCKERIANSSTS